MCLCVCVCETYPQLLKRCIYLFPHCCGCCVVEEELVHMVGTESCSDGTVLLETVREKVEELRKK